MTKLNPALINKTCDLCGTLIAGKRVKKSQRDGLYRCEGCQRVRSRDVMTKHQNAALCGPKAEQYKATRNAAKRAWEERNPEGKRARGLIKSVRARLKKYDYCLDRFERPSTRELAKALTELPDHCVKCGTLEDLTTEHIKPVVDYPELALDVANLTTLCRSCNTRSYHAR